jgi:hypothetical protein
MAYINRISVSEVNAEEVHAARKPEAMNAIRNVFGYPRIAVPAFLLWTHSDSTVF